MRNRTFRAKHALRKIFTCVLSLCLLFSLIGTFAFSANDEIEIALLILKNPLKSTEARKKALQFLVQHETDGLPLELIAILKNTKESIVFRRSATQGLIDLGSMDVQHQIKPIVFEHRDLDLFTRKSSIRILWEITPPADRELLLENFLRLVQNQNEVPQLRDTAIGFISNAGYVPKNTNWAARLIQNKREPVPVRTAALTYMETNQFEALEILLPTLMMVRTEDSNFRQILILKGAHLYSKMITPAFKTILSNQKETYKIRHLCLQLLMQDYYATNLETYLRKMVTYERNEKLKQEFREAIESLKKESLQ